MGLLFIRKQERVVMNWNHDIN